MIKLYSKKLNSLEALRQEKAIKKAAIHSNIKNTDTTNEEILPDFIQAGFDIISSKGIADKLFAIALPALNLAGKKLEKDLLKSFAKEFIGGYAKWKAIELGLKAAASFFRKKD